MKRQGVVGAPAALRIKKGLTSPAQMMALPGTKRLSDPATGFGKVAGAKKSKAPHDSQSGSQQALVLTRRPPCQQPRKVVIKDLHGGNPDAWRIVGPQNADHVFIANPSCLPPLLPGGVSQYPMNDCIMPFQ
ncbi:hypothetical protein [Bordetella avium]|uniref:hypothetical protein n=1 Tax=Bordetella avium TaxID=521 RepID=UPI001F4E0CE2|nr:hypothetical protein [Bordetella avium]